MIDVTLEIEYTYSGYQTGPVTSWMYTRVKGKDFTDCVEKGKKYFQKTVKGLGWTKLTDLVEVRKITHGKDLPLFKLVVDDRPSSKPSPRLAKRSSPNASRAKPKSKRAPKSRRT